jgi:DNA-binding LacI/PurR family transcriptional regulator
MRAAGCEVARLDRHTVDGIGEGEKVALELLRTKNPPTALVCASDQLALGARRAADIPIIGFDDSPMAQAAGLSSVRQPLGEAAAECVQLLTALLDKGAGAAPRHVLLEPNLIIR